MTTPRSLSFVDIAKIPGGIAIMQKNSKDEIDNLLFQYGFDTKYGWELVECNHRPLTSNQAVFGFRVEGIERVDQDWLDSGFASMEARMEAVKDPSLRDALLEMCRTGSSDKTWTNEDTAEAVVRKEQENTKPKKKV